LLKLKPNESIDVSEWVSVDSRSVPHTVVVTVAAGLKTRVLIIEKASERIDEADVCVSLRANSLRLGARNALTA